MPARKLNDTYTGLPKGIDILINAENLPPLPSLPSNLEHLPYTRYKRKLPSAGSSLTELRQHVAHQRREFVGDSVVKIFVVDWLINQHHCLYTRVAAVRLPTPTIRVCSQTLDPQLTFYTFAILVFRRCAY